MSVPRRGMVLAAGFGTRLLPVTRHMPKALLPIAGEPILLRILRWLDRQGVAEVAINGHHLADALQAWIERTSEERTDLPKIRFFPEREILGTGGGIANAASFLCDDPVVIANSDQLFEPDLKAATRHHERNRFAATMLLAHDPWHAQIRTRGDQVVEIAPRPVFGDPDLWGFSGVYLLSTAAVDEIRREATEGGTVRFHDVLPHLRRWMAEGRVGGLVDPRADFREIGTPEAWIEVLRERERPGASWIDAQAQVADGACVEESILLPGARIEADSIVSRAILGYGSVVRGPADRMMQIGTDAVPLRLLPREIEEEARRFLQSAWPAVGGDLPSPAGAAMPDGGSFFRLRQLQGDGSARTVLRVARGRETRVLVLPPRPGVVSTSIYPRREGAPSEAEAFHYVVEYLHRLGVPVPRLEAFDPASGRTLLEDLGDTHLADLWREGQKNPQGTAFTRALAAYEEAVDLLGRMQQAADPPFDLSRTHNLEYDEEFILTYEAGYFLQRMVAETCRLSLEPAEEAVLREECRGLARQALEGAPRLFLHRDYQSRNLMATPRGLVVIDVQGARLGPPEYDLVSLVEDPYADLPDEIRDRLVARYLEGAAPAAVAADPARFRRRYAASMVNRLLQALGAFAYLGGTLRKKGFLEHAPSAVRALRRRAPLAGTRLDAVLEAVGEKLPG